TLRPGDLLLLQADTIDETVEYVKRYLETHQTAREVSLPEALVTAPTSLPIAGRVESAAAGSTETQVAIAAFAG
ncbi:MAG TPA: hypothetical protein VGI75_05425, partial [Pirellulales bacterium]